ncbi:acyltransferase [Sphingomonas sp. JC676]|uniref:acyltransferase family protein n=1 Tax=Sphingomonas sp. JC676 TaxID=2768065 RepID=UPI001657F0A4|nr:acyltransferase [Sphingomonas sp. JC676]MBC9032793.1 acyltransferase [Sphingomonas sp. JC676]
MTVIDDKSLRPQNNDLTMVRLLLATLVIYSHSFYAVFDDDHDDLATTLGVPISNYAVDGFFILSGFLVYRSLVTNNSLRFFALARLTRLWPALFVMMIVVTLGGLAFTTSSLAAYFIGTDTLKFIFFNTTFVFYGANLTGVHCGAELCNVNGSLWTLPWEARCYVILALLGGLRLAGAKPMTYLILPATLAFAVLWDVGAANGLSHVLGRGISYQFERLDRLWVAFALGIAAYLFRHRIPLSWWICLALLLANIGVQQFVPPAGLHARAVFMAYFVLCLGFLGVRKTSVSSNWPDYSYGMYIYAFPVMFVLQRVFAFESPYALAVCNVLGTVPLAALSWHFVEKPALNQLKRYRKRLATAPKHPEPLAPEVVAPGAA